jgi:hypothetical protein
MPNQTKKRSRNQRDKTQHPCQCASSLSDLTQRRFFAKQRFVARPTDGWLKALIAGAGAGSGLLAKRSESA